MKSGARIGIESWNEIEVMVDSVIGQYIIKDERINSTSMLTESWARVSKIFSYAGLAVISLKHHLASDSSHEWVIRRLRRVRGSRARLSSELAARDNGMSFKALRVPRISNFPLSTWPLVFILISSESDSAPCRNVIS
ncbi:hypothetical protein EVAR_6811_1 [Eumeta japonica]|uniref:Uncharacterized protein n=1 Tax=Eumeta variegata TaxID=151549 RepID=A0A4C1U6A7_EUMVA|nr:hypothetical protein EVAR_6811_1 [Eumeta japonica]